MSQLAKKLKNKIDTNKTEKQNKLLDAAFKLFSEKGINNTSIQDIVEEAGVAKGTFYLYFKDKYDLQEVLTIKKSYELFHNATNELNKNVLTNFEDQLIFIIDNVINQLNNNIDLVKLIYKDLSMGFYNTEIHNIIDNEEVGIYESFMKGIKENNVKLENPEVTLYMIIELVSSTIFNSIIRNIPMPIDEYKPFLYKTIRVMLKN